MSPAIHNASMALTSQPLSLCVRSALKVWCARPQLLVGSERIHGGEHGGSQATGKHFKEACHINKSLTTLGRCAIARACLLWLAIPA